MFLGCSDRVGDCRNVFFEINSTSRTALEKDVKRNNNSDEWNAMLSGGFGSVGSYLVPLSTTREDKTNPIRCKPSVSCVLFRSRCFLEVVGENKTRRGCIELN